MEDPVIPCQRCGNEGGTAYQGWQLLCPRCIANDLNELYEDE